MGKGKSKLHNFSVTQYVIERPVGQSVGSNLRLAPKDLRLDIRDLHTSLNVI